MYGTTYKKKKYNYKRELQHGINEELEHKKTIYLIRKRALNPYNAAKLIAKDHLREDKHYYTKLQKTMKKRR